MNRLQHETSPYLLQHANDPVHWHPWDAEALKLAKHKNVPILLSIGYSANHMCHVMAHESFETPKVAKFMNDNFVNIKVDREERPDLDRIYQNAQQLLNRQPGGWPLTMFLDPTDQLPIFGGTYFPPQQTRNMPSFRDVLSGIAKTYGNQNDKMKEFKSKLLEALVSAPSETTAGDLDATLIDRACGQIDGSFDEQHGGFSEAPKLPHPAGLDMMLDVAASTNEPEKSTRLLHMLDFTLSAISRGGLYDHLGGGFFGHSVDATWTIPHFEKMLFDNGMLLSLFARRAQQSGSPWFSHIANETADWILREMRLDNGGICASLAAGAHGEEGQYYVWSTDEVRAVVDDEYEAFAERFGMDKKANFGGRWHLRLPEPDSSVPLEQLNPSTESLVKARADLLRARNDRTRPARDDKVLTAWNALAINGLVDAAAALDRPDCLDAASDIVDCLFQSNWQAGRLLATSRDGHGNLNAYLDDYAYLLDAILALLGQRWRDSDLTFAIALADALLENFEDENNGAFFFTSHDHESLIQRNKAYGDDSLPSGIGTAVRSLMELGSLLGEQRYLNAAERALRGSLNEVERWPSAHATLIRALYDFISPPARVVLRTDAMDEAGAWRNAMSAHADWRARCYVIPTAAKVPAGVLSDRRADDAASVTAYVYRAQQSSGALTDLVAFGDGLNA